MVWLGCAHRAAGTRGVVEQGVPGSVGLRAPSSRCAGRCLFNRRTLYLRGVPWGGGCLDRATPLARLQACCCLFLRP